LRWSPAEAWSATIPELLLAVDALVEWTNMTNPFGGSQKAPDRKAVARDLRMGLRVVAATRPGAEGE
jgi:hypothetical protein